MPTNIKAAMSDWILNAQTALSSATRQTARQSLRAAISTRIYSGTRLQGQPMPALTMQQNGGTPDHGLDGQLVTLRRQDVLLTVFANQRDVIPATDLANWVIDLFVGFQGTMEGVAVKSILLDNDPFDRPVRPIDGGAKWIDQIPIQLRVAYVYVAD